MGCTVARKASLGVEILRGHTNATAMRASDTQTLDFMNAEVSDRTLLRFMVIKDLNECEKFPDVCSDPKSFCCMDLPPPAKFACSPPIQVAPVESLSVSPGRSYDDYDYKHSSNHYPETKNFYEILEKRSYPHESARISHENPGEMMRMAEVSPFLGGSYPNDLEVDGDLLQWLKNGVRMLMRPPSEVLRPPPGVAYMMEQWTPPAILNARNQAQFPQMMRRWVDSLLPEQSERPWTPPRRLSINDELPLMGENIIRRFAEVAIQAVPQITDPTSHNFPYLPHFPSLTRQPYYSPAGAQCPSGFVNLHQTRQRAALERIPEAAGQWASLMRQMLPLNYGGKIDPAAIAVGMATNANSAANQLAAWYKAFVALPEAIEGATQNVTGLNVKDDLEHVLSAGVSAAEPIMSLLSNVVQMAPTSGAANALNAIGQIVQRGSGPILAPIANL